MIRNGDVIQGYTILATANGMALAHSETAPDPYVVWFIDEDGCGVRNGKYQQTKEDAEWDFCCKAFPWFEDNAPVNMIEDKAAERIEKFKGYIEDARRALFWAAVLVDGMVLEHSKLEDKKKAPQEESAEQEPLLTRNFSGRGHRVRHIISSCESGCRVCDNSQVSAISQQQKCRE